MLVGRSYEGRLRGRSMQVGVVSLNLTEVQQKEESRPRSGPGDEGPSFRVLTEVGS
jgi:hypothetical protein